MDISVHDNNLHSYCVDAEKNEIRLHTSYAAPALQEYTDIVFAGVAAYGFELDNFMTIMLDVYETKAYLII